MASKIEFETELKSNPEKVWKSINDFTTLFPKAFPDLYESVVALVGDGNSVGSVRIIKYAKGILPNITTTTEKIEVVDEETKTLSYSVIDGEILKLYKSYKATMVVTANNSNHGTVLKYLGEYEKVSEQVPNPDIVGEFIVKNFQELDAYLLKA